MVVMGVGIIDCFVIVILAGSIDAICGRVLARAGRYAIRQEICAQSARKWAIRARRLGGDTRRDMGDADIKKTPYREI